LNSLLDKIIASAPQCNYNGSGILVTVAPDGKPVNTTGCAPTQTQNQPGAGQTYDCNGQKIPVTQPCQQQTQTVCAMQPNPYTGIPQQVCQQVNKQQAEAMQKAQENQQMGQLLGQLMKGFGGGQNGTGQNGANNPFGGGGGGGGGGGNPFGGGGVPTPGPTPGAAVQQGKELLEFCAKPENADKPQCSASNLAKAKAVIDAAEKDTSLSTPYSNLTPSQATDRIEAIDKSLRLKKEALEEAERKCDPLTGGADCKNAEKYKKEIQDLEDQKEAILNRDIRQGWIYNYDNCKFYSTDGLKVTENTKDAPRLVVIQPVNTKGTRQAADLVELLIGKRERYLLPKSEGKSREAVGPEKMPHAGGNSFCFIGQYAMTTKKIACFNAKPDEKNLKERFAQPVGSDGIFKMVARVIPEVGVYKPYNGKGCDAKTIVDAAKGQTAGPDKEYADNLLKSSVAK